MNSGRSEVRILFASADQLCARNLRGLLPENGGPRYALEQSGELPVIFERLRQGGADVLLLDLSSPCNPGVELIEQLRAEGHETPIVALAPRSAADLAAASLRAGVQEYLDSESLNGPNLIRALSFAIERKRADQLLRDRDSGFQTLFAGNPLPMWIYDVETLRFLEVNDAAIEHYGYSNEEFLSMCISDIRPAEDLPRLQEYIMTPRGDFRHAGEWRHRLKDGRVIDVDITSHSLDLAGRAAVLVVARNVTNEKTALQALREAEEKYREIFDNAVVGIFQTTPDGRYLSANQALARMYGFDSPAEMMSTRTDIANQVYVHPSRREDLKRLLHSEGVARNFPLQVLRKDGSPAWMLENSRAVRDAAGNVLFYEGTQQDITEWKKAEEALAASEERYRGLFKNAVHGIFVSRPKEGVVEVNPALMEMLGYDSREEMLSKDIARDIYRNPEDRKTILEQINQGTLRGAEADWVRKDGSVIRVRLSGRVSKNEQGEVEETEVIVENVTEAKKLEQQLRQAQKMEAIGRLAGGVAHDFNNLLAVMVGHCELIAAQMSAEDPFRKQIEVISKAGSRAAELTRQLLAFSRQQVLQPRILNLNEVIEDTQKMLPRLLGTHIEISVRLDSFLGQIKADPGQVDTVLINLAANARDAMSQGGRLTITTRNVDFAPHPPPPCAGMKPGPYVHLEVRDTGSGMDPGTQARIFEPFYTTKEIGRGTGLGLATVEGIVSQSGAFISVESEPGRGTAFHIYFPRLDNRLTLAVSPPAGTLAPRGTETILLVEDSEALRLLTRDYLVRQGYTVLEAETGPAAVRIAADHHGTIPLLITDVVMPQMNGPALAHILLRSHPGLKVLYISGYSSELLDSAGGLGTSQAFLQKPYSMNALARKIRDLLDAPAH